jgi:hypothetical protein
MTLEPATFRLVAQCLNQVSHSVQQVFHIQLYRTMTVVTIKQYPSFGHCPSLRGPTVLLASVSDLVLLPTSSESGSRVCPRDVPFPKHQDHEQSPKEGDCFRKPLKMSGWLRRIYWHVRFPSTVTQCLLSRHHHVPDGVQ